MTGALSIEYLAVGQLKVYDRNARTHSNRQILQIANSIREFGFTNPVLIDDRNMILAGHGRVRAADLLEIKEVPCVRLSTVTQAQKRACCCDDGGSTQVTEISAAPDIRPSPVVSSKPAPQCGLLLFEPDDAGCSELAIILSCHRKMLTPAHTRLTLDDEELSLLDAEFDIGVTRFSIAEIDMLVDGLAVEEPGAPREDLLPPLVDGEAVTKPGDVWLLGRHRLISWGAGLCES